MNYLLQTMQHPQALGIDSTFVDHYPILHCCHGVLHIGSLLISELSFLFTVLVKTSILLVSEPDPQHARV